MPTTNNQPQMIRISPLFRWIAPCAVILVHGAFASSQTTQSVAQSPLQASRTARAPQQPGLSSAVQGAPEGIADLRLTPGTLINVQVFEEPDLDGAYRVDDKGSIAMPLVGSIKVQGFSLRETEGAIRQQLISEQILNAPHVVVNVADYGAQNIVVAGEVTNPGRVPIIAPRPLQEVLASAGGTTPLASDEVVIHRAGQTPDKQETVRYNAATGQVGTGVMIAPGDTIFVKRAGSVYVLGAVNRPGGFVMQNEGSLNVVEALALAYGTAPEAAIPRVRILRRVSEGNYEFVPVPLNKIQKGKATPTPLQAGDIVYVPPSTIKEVGITARSLLSGVAGAAVYRAP